jgi:hypothetical protein
MQWLSENWLFVLIAVGMVAMHLFGHGGHGGHDDDKDKPGKHRH